MRSISRYIYSGFERTVWGDEPFYLWLGRNWFRGDDYNFAFTGHWDYHHTPGYPFITAVLTQLTGDMQRASEWSFILFSVLLVLIVYALARRIYGWRSAFAAGVIDPSFPASDERFQQAALNDSGGVFLRRYWARGRIDDQLP